MKHVEYTYTCGMTDAEIEDRLRAAETGILALADGCDAYAVPLAHYYDGEDLYFRLGVTENSTKRAFWERTQTACYVLHGAEPTDNPRGLDTWSVIVTGEIVELPAADHEGFDTAELNRHFSPIRVFDEPIGEIEITIAKLDVDVMTGRRTPGQ